VKIIGCAVFAGLLWYSMRYTQFILPGGDEIPLETRDAAWKNLMGLLAVGILWFGLFRLERKGDSLLSYRICTAALFLSCAWVGLWCFWWILSADRVPVGDQAYVYGAASYFREGNYYFFGAGGYLGMFPYQMGLVLLMEIVFLFAGAYHYFAFEVLCACMAVGIVVVGYRIVRAMTNSVSAMVFYCVSMMGCIPLILYTSWVYGDLPSIFFTLLAFDFLLVYEEKKRTKWLVFLAAAVVLAMLARVNSLIFVLALVLAGAVCLVQKWDRRLFAALILSLILPQLVYTGIYKFYEIRSGAEQSDGIPYVATIAMGLQEGWHGSGWYNNYHKVIYGKAGLDRDLTARIAKREIRIRLAAFREDPSYTVEFFKSKILSQWNEPLYQAVYFNTNYAEPSNPPREGSLAESISGRNFSRVLSTADRVQFIVYAGVLLYFIFGVKRDSRLLHHVPAITLIGGFLFSIIWEAKARYIFPYFVTMFPVAAVGYLRSVQFAAGMIDGIRKPKQEDNIIEFRKTA